MSPEERAAAVDALPAAMTDAEASPPEGDLHYDAKNDARETLREWFRRVGRSVYVAAEMTTYYPGERRFAPDVLVVCDVPVHDRTKWVVDAEGRGLDWVLEVHVGGDRKKDVELNVARYARLGIAEYFVYDRARQRLSGYRLAAGTRGYAPIVPQLGHYPSHVLGLDLTLEDGGLRFYHASAELLTPRDLAKKLGALVEGLAAERDAEAERARTEAERANAAEAEAARLREELDALRRES